jgi:hypothetical protein
MIFRWLALAVAAISLLVGLGCDDGGTRDSVNVGVVEGELPPGFPDDFPAYPGLEVVRSTPLGSRYVIEGSSPDAPAEVAAFYERELARPPWEILEPSPESEDSVQEFRFSRPGLVQEGRVTVVEGADGEGTGVGIAMPFEAFDEP